jgi:glycosyltransferase involved in cell wall biosynthesis
MKVCFNTYPWAFGVPGGGERQLQFCLAALQRAQHKWPELQFELFNQWRPDFSDMRLMHYFSCMPSSSDFLGAVKGRHKVPIVMSPNFWPDPDSWGDSGVQQNIKTLLWLADRVIVNSVIEEEALVRLCKIDSSYISVVHNAVEDCFFEPVPSSLFRETYGVHGPYVLNVGNVEPRKNQLAFLKALKAFPKLQLITIGGVRDNWYLEACVEEGGDQFRLIDALPPSCELIRSAMAGCEFFAMPSLRETPSIASLEAGAAGARILTTDLGSTTEYFEQHAVYVNPFDIDSMQDGVRAIIALPRNEALVERIRQLYRWDIVVEQLVDVYSTVLEKVVGGRN